MKIGDSIYVTAGRDKDRGATLVELDYVNRTAKVDYGGGHIIPVDYSCIRPMVEEKVATKHDTEKNRLELIPASALEALGRAMTYGSRKYDDHNWANGFEWDRLVGSLMRHLNAWRAGQDNDPESGLSHIDHVLANAAMLASHIEEGLGNDNRRKTIS